MKLSLLILSSMLSLSAVAQQVVHVKGNDITLAGAATAVVIDAVTGQEINSSIPATPERINGDTIISNRYARVAPAVIDAHGKELKICNYIFSKNQPLLELLEDGDYLIDVKTPIIDKHGAFIYTAFDGIKRLHRKKQGVYAKDNSTFVRVSTEANDSDIPLAIKNKVNMGIKHTLEHLPALRPAEWNNKTANSTGYLFSGSSYIVVANHHATFNPDFFAL
jgi:hypothetical protein